MTKFLKWKLDILQFQLAHIKVKILGKKKLQILPFVSKFQIVILEIWPFFPQNFASLSQNHNL